jgi:hypothetical protein
MNDLELLNFFFDAEGTGHTRETLSDAMNDASRKSSYLTFNIFNVIVDRDRKRIRLQEDFAPSREAEYSFDEFRTRLAVEGRLAQRQDHERPNAEDE